MEILKRIDEFFFYKLNIDIKSTIVAFAIVLIFIVFRKIFTKYILKSITKFTSKTKSKIDDELVIAFKKPMRSAITVLGIYLALAYLPLKAETYDVLSKYFRSYIIIMLAWGLYNLEGTYLIFHKRIENRFNFKTKEILKPLLTKSLRIITIILAIGMIFDEFDYNINGFVAGLGLGGLAVAMAAKDTLANILGGLVIIIDKPFDIGDWIKVTDIEGVVESISFRSTKIRTFSKVLVSVPNSKIADESISNFSKREIRRIDFKLGVTYNTSKEKLKNCIDAIETMLTIHPKVNKENILVKFDEFNDSSLDVFIYFFTNTSNWENYLNIKQDINFKIMEILEQKKVSVAFPSTSIYFENTLKHSDSNRK